MPGNATITVHRTTLVTMMTRHRTQSPAHKNNSVRVQRNRFSRSLSVSKMIAKLAITQTTTVLSAKNDSDVMLCLQHYLGLIIDSSPVH